MWIGTKMTREQSEVIEYNNDQEFVGSSSQPIPRKTVLEDSEFLLVLKQSVIQGMKRVLGEDKTLESAGMVIANIERPTEFGKTLRSVFGSASHPFEKAILEELYNNIGLQFPKRKGYEFADYVCQAEATLLERRAWSGAELSRSSLNDVRSKTSSKVLSSESRLVTPDSKSAIDESDVMVEIDAIRGIKAIQEESKQISELAEFERCYCSEVANLFKDIIHPLKMSYRINPVLFSKSDYSISDIILTPNAELRIFHGQSNIVSRSLGSVESEVLTRIVEELMPYVESLINDSDQDLGHEKTTLERLSGDIRRLIGVRSKSSTNLNFDSSER